MNALFTSAGRRVELLRAFRRAYQELGMGGTIVAVDADPLAPALRVADEARVVPRITDRGYVPALVAACRAYAIDLVFPLVDPDIPVLAAACPELESTGARVVTVSERAARIAADKFLTARFLADLAVPAPATWSPADIPAAVAFPVIVKPRLGSAGKGVFEALDRRQLEFFLSYVDRPVVQERLPGPEITSDVVCDLQGNVMAVVSRRRIEVRAGEVAKGVTVHDPEIADHCVAIAKGLEAIGPINVQCILRDGRPYFTEVNARFGGGIPLAIAAGVDAPRWLLAVASGRTFQPPPLGTYLEGLHITRFDDSFFLAEGEPPGGSS